MLTKRIKASWIIVLIQACIGLIICIVTIIRPELLVKTDFKVFIGMQWHAFVESNQQVATYLILIFRELSVIGFVLYYLSIAIIIMAYRKGESWSWYILFSGSTIGYLFLVILDSFIGNITFVIIFVILLLIAWSGFIIGAKDFLKGTS
jgi:hypothetical protein